MRRRVITIVIARLSQEPAVDARLVTGTSFHSFNASSTVPAPI
jgi:hypothetical protein